MNEQQGLDPMFQENGSQLLLFKKNEKSFQKE